MKPAAFTENHRAQESADGPPARSAESDIGTSVTNALKPSRLWLWFVAAFVVQFAAWTAWFVIAAHHQVEDVPLATGTRK
jgi:hypothetical protein